MYDYAMDENVQHEQRDFPNSSNVPSVSVDSGLEMSNDSDGSNSVTQNDNNLSTSRLPIPYTNVIHFPHDLISVSDDSDHRFTKCIIEEIDQPASSLSKDVFDSSQLTRVVSSARNRFQIPVTRDLWPRRNTPYVMKARRLYETWKKLGFGQKSCKSNRRGAKTAIKHMITINASRENRMCFAASTNHVEAVERLLNSGVSPNCRDAMGRTPLHIAGRSGYSSIINLLLEHGADAKLYDISGTTALQAARTSGDESSITLLDRAASQPNSRFRFEITTGFPSSISDDPKPEVRANIDNYWTNDARGFDQQVEALSNVCSRLSFANSIDEFQGSS